MSSIFWVYTFIAMCFLKKTKEPGAICIIFKKLCAIVYKPVVIFKTEANNGPYLKNNMITLKAIKNYLQSIC